MLTFNLNKYELNNNGIMLDVGCGEGRHIFGVMQDYPQMKCVGLDMDNASLNRAEEGYQYFESISNAGAEFIKGSAYSLPFPDESIDLIVCSEVLEHLHEYNDAVVEIHRVLKPGGKFYASVPASWPEKVCWSLSKDYQNQPGGHLRIFNQLELVSEIKESGFKFLSSEKFHSIHSPYWWLRCLFWKSQDSNFLVNLYKRMLERHILKKPFFLNLLDKALNPLMGKSFSMYFEKL
ncbi:MAG: type 11 methyltransferase [Gammaproteobacteria bacterium]|nr:type 11 methyltransferase [Gammaproteobacteria bacterium]|tara:strand:+ start:1108 stop:1812 length:705 start_codon:yes stop_codon:yes gene_type:complete